MDWQGWLNRIEQIERANPDKRVTLARIPGGLPKVGWNVQNMHGARRWDTAGVHENMRTGVFSSFPVESGPFMVRFNTGETVK